MEITRIVMGDLRRGRRPYVQIHGQRYSNSTLWETPTMIGTRLIIQIDPEDAHQINAFLPNGKQVGALYRFGRGTESRGPYFPDGNPGSQVRLK